jgi:hypothetical protein
VISHGGQYSGMNQSMLLRMPPRWSQDGFAEFILDQSEFYAQVANKVCVFENAADSAFPDLIHGYRWREMAQ